MKELLSKAEILSWYKRAKARLELRKAGRLNGWQGYLSKQDYEAYSASIEALFLRQKKAFNEQLRRRTHDAL